MFDLNSVKHIYPFELPEYFYPLAETFDGDGSKPLVSEEEMTAVENATKVDKECFVFLRKMNADLFADPVRNLAARFLRYVLFEARKPWENYLYAPVWFEIPGYQTPSVDLLIITAALGYTLSSVNILPYLYYPSLMAISALIVIMFIPDRKKAAK